MNIQENQSVSSSMTEACMTMYLHGEDQSCDLCGKQTSFYYTVDASYSEINEQLKWQALWFCQRASEIYLTIKQCS